MDGSIFRIGRLEYRIKKLQSGLMVYKNRKTSRIRLIMPAPGSSERILVEPDGHFSPFRGEIPSDWMPVLTDEDYVLDMHIPGGGKLTEEAIRDSMKRGIAFFDTFFPERETKGFECVSWIFSRDLDAVYPRNANLIRFRNQVYLFPVESEKVDGSCFLFGTTSKDPEDWPENTSIQRTLKKHIRQGGAFRLSGMIYLREDLSRFGDFPYRE
jgi:hypothetical protein